MMYHLQSLFMILGPGYTHTFSAQVTMAELGLSCDYCGKENVTLKRCGRCLKTAYCTKSCQTIDWATHKHVCGKRTDQNQRYEENNKHTDRSSVSGVNSQNGKNIETSKSPFVNKDKRNNTQADADRCAEELKKVIADKMKREYSDTNRRNGTPEKYEDSIGSISEDCRRSPSSIGRTEYTDMAFANVVANKQTDINISDFHASNETETVRAGVFQEVDEFRTSDVNKCAKCGVTDCSQKCSQCKQTFYCSRKCQKDDWLHHKQTCKKVITEEEENIRKLHKKMTKQNSKSRKVDGMPVVWSTKNYEGPKDRFYQMLTLEQALIRATRPEGSLQQAVRLARSLFPLHDIILDFDEIPDERVFPFFPFFATLPRRSGYIMVAFMYRYHEHAMRHGVYLKDASDKDSKVEFYFDHLGDNPLPYFSYSDVKPGGYICLRDPLIHVFGDGSVGIRINDPAEVKILDIKLK